ncbi:MAG: AraC-like DNA-binding protein [Paraglaciecola sp.]|jgi:AraC-like DNA-binding protein
MSKPSQWPLPPESFRFVVPLKQVEKLKKHPLSAGLYTTGLGYYKQAKGHEMQRNIHDDHLLMYCLHGKGELRAENTTSQIKAGDIVVLPKGVPHRYKASKDQPWTIYWVHFCGSDCENFLDYLAIEKQKYIIPLGIHSRLVTSFEYLLECRQTNYDTASFINVANLLRQMLSHIALLGPISRRQQAKHQLDLELVHSLMEASVHEKLELETLAKEVNLSKFHFIKKYRELTGSTPVNHFIHLKIKRACDLLDITNKSINEISYAIGYEDAYYFSRIFKKVMGISPSQYRNTSLGHG